MFIEKFQNDIDNCNESYEQDDCNVNAFQEIDVGVYITIEPFSGLGEVKVERVDDPYIASAPCCTCNKNETCKFTIAQKLCVKVPIEFRVSASNGPTFVICGDKSNEDCPTNVCDENVGNKPETSYKFYIKGKLVE